MHLTRLELQGFKSFGKKTTLVFPKGAEGKAGVTAVVGPNGSGKTNIVDAIRWVLGEQSPKILRVKKSDDVIFAGSAKKASVGFAEVSLSIENDDKKLPLEFSEVTITRRAYRSGENEYLLNKNKVRLQDIVQLLAEAQFGQKTYAVIGQGMVDAILSATPFERKDFFDDAAGVKPYNLKKDQTQLKLKATKENLNQAEVLLQEIEPRYRSLLRQVKKFERREETMNELRELQTAYYGNLWKSLSRDVERIQSSLDKAREHADVKNAEIKNLRHEMAQIERQIKSGTTISSCLDELSTLHGSLLKKIHDRSIDFGGVETEVQAISEKIENWKRTLASSGPSDQTQSLLQRFFDLQKKYLDEQEKLQTLFKGREEIEITLTREQTNKENLEKEIETEMSISKEAIGGLFQNSTANPSPQEELREQIRRVKSQLEIIGGIDPETKKEFEETKERYEFLKTQSEDLKNAIASLEKVIGELDAKIEHQFNEAFEAINEKFSYYFQHVFSGGSASLELVKEERALAANEEAPITDDEETAEEAAEEESPKEIKIGVDIKTSPPGKRVKHIASLSGGERALTSLALLYAILAYHPSPFVVLDEVDASLDETNSRRCMEILRDLASTIQFIVITHNRNTMEGADTLYGVTGGEDGISRLLSLKFEELKEA